MQHDTLPLPSDCCSVADELRRVFNPNAGKYKRCFGVTHVKKLASSTGTLHITFSGIFLGVCACLCFLVGELPTYVASFATPAAICTPVVMVDFFFSYLLLYGVSKEQPWCILPFILLMNFVTIIGIAVSCYFIFYISVPIGLLIGCGMILNSFCAHSAWRCFGYLKCKKASQRVNEVLTKHKHIFNLEEAACNYFVVPQPPSYADIVENDQKSLLTAA